MLKFLHACFAALLLGFIFLALYLTFSHGIDLLVTTMRMRLSM
jgi:hypothetical protein